MITEHFWWRCAFGKHPSTSRTRWLRPLRPMILYWRRYGKAGGCQIKMGVQLSWESTCLASRGSRVRISPSPFGQEHRPCSWPMYIENFIQKVLRKNICDILIKTSENREYRKIRSVQITKRKHSYSITEKLFKKADPVSNAIETETGQAKKSAGWMPWH